MNKPATTQNDIDVETSRVIEEWKNKHGAPFKVTADHPILARPDKTGMNLDSAIAYANDLIRQGFENVTILKDGEQ